jgi:hypothetical protein
VLGKFGICNLLFRCHIGEQLDNFGYCIFEVTLCEFFIFGGQLLLPFLWLFIGGNLGWVLETFSSFHFFKIECAEVQ